MWFPWTLSTMFTYLLTSRYRHALVVIGIDAVALADADIISERKNNNKKSFDFCRTGTSIRGAESEGTCFAEPEMYFNLHKKNLLKLSPRKFTRNWC